MLVKAHTHDVTLRALAGASAQGLILFHQVLQRYVFPPIQRPQEPEQPELVEDTKIASRLYEDFKTFMIGANRKMHFYEQEVLAIACGRTYQHIVQNHVYVCPNTKSYHHKKSLYLTFVHDGVMTELFKLKAQYTLPPDPQRIQEMAIPNDDKEVIVRYFTNLRSDRRTADFHTGNDYVTGVVVYVLCGDEDSIQLPPGTKAKKMIRGKAYFKLADMLNPKKCTALVPATQADA